MQMAPDRSFGNDPLWHRIIAHPIGGEAAAAAFTRHLARENLWTAAHAEAVVTEYRRFCYLACVAGFEVTPSDAVDQAWHLHLTYTRDYWDGFCPHSLGRPLHHLPGDGTAGAADRFASQYGKTLGLYGEIFGHAAPAAIWPAPAQRFAQSGVRIDAGQFLLVRKKSLPGRLLRLFARPGR